MWSEVEWLCKPTHSGISTKRHEPDTAPDSGTPTEPATQLVQRCSTRRRLRLDGNPSRDRLRVAPCSKGTGHLCGHACVCDNVEGEWSPRQVRAHWRSIQSPIAD